jgi:hypothetical protein
MMWESNNYFRSWEIVPHSRSFNLYSSPNTHCMKITSTIVPNKTSKGKVPVCNELGIQVQYGAVSRCSTGGRVTQCGGGVGWRC